MSLDSVSALENALSTCNSEIEEFASNWAEAAGELKSSEKRFERLLNSALRGTEGRNAEERRATAFAAVDAVEEGLALRIEHLIGAVESYKTRFRTIDRRSNNAQSLLSVHKESARLESFQPRDPNQATGAAQAQ